MIGIELGQPAVVLRGAEPLPLLIDVIENRYQRGAEIASSFSGLSGTSFSRSGAGTALTAAGAVSAFATGVPRITDRGLLLEEARTNLQVRSADGVQWSASGVTRVESGAGFLPGGRRVLITDPGAAGAFNRIISPGNVSVVSGTAYRLSLFYEPGSSNGLRLLLDASGSTGMVRDADGTWSAAGVALGVMTLVSDEVLNGAVRRAVIGWTPSGSASGAFGVGPNASGPDETLIFHGLQVEAGAVASAPIITAGSAVTRGADVASVVVPEGASIWEAVHGTANTVVSGAVTPGAIFDLVAGRPWVGLGQELKRLVMR